MSNEQITLRDTLEASFDAAEAREAEQVAAQPIAADPAPESNQASEESTAIEKTRDDQGRFAPKPAEAVKVEAETAPAQPDQQTEAPTPRPTTWKKEHMPAWEKMAKGEALTPDESRKLAQYTVQREREFATGVSTYRAEAQNAKQLTDALAPYMSTIQQRGLAPAAFVQEMGRTHEVLMRGTPQQKMQAIAELARNVGVPIEAIQQQQGGQLDPVVPQMMQYIQQLESKVNGVASWRDSQENQAVNGIIAKFQDAGKYPHFEAVRMTMGQLMERGFTADPDAAYQMAVGMDGNLRETFQAPAAQPAIAAPVDKVAAAAQARAKVISPRSTAPSGTPQSINPKDIRSAIENAWDAHSGAGRV
jgi:hypothetical protein